MHHRVLGLISVMSVSLGIAVCARTETRPVSKVVPAAQAKPEEAQFVVVGRWNVTVDTGRDRFPSWLEISRSGFKTLVGRFVGQFGSARPIAQVFFQSGHIRFALPPQWEDRSTDLTFEGDLTGEQLKGTTTGPKGEAWTWTAVRAPALKRAVPPHWGTPLNLFNGKDLAGWQQRRPTDSKVGWSVSGGLLINDRPGVDIITTQKFTDFKLHTEFRYPKGSNSGLYLRGRYEVQIEDNYGEEPRLDGLGGVYGFLLPRINAGKAPGEWQTCDVTLAGREVTVVLNGETVIDRQTIPGTTGGALDNDEAAPGPLMIQGDHGRVEFRAVTLTPAI